MTKYKFVSASKCEQAAHRLSKFINCEMLMQYARKVRNPHDLEQLSCLLSNVGRIFRCNQDDLDVCIAYVDSLAADKYRPMYVKQYNRNCQQFYGDIHQSEFNNPKYNHRNLFAA